MNSSVGTSNVTTTLFNTYKRELDVWFGTNIFLSTLGVSANALVMLVMLTSASSRTGSGLLIVHLLFLLLLQCGINSPIIYVTTFNVPHHGSPSILFCRWTTFIYYWIFYAVDWADLAIGVNRFVAVLFPHRYATWTSRHALTAFIAAPWMIGFALTLYLFLGIGASLEPLKPWGSCGLRMLPGSAYPYTVQFGLTFPLVTLGVLYLTLLGYVGMQVAGTRVGGGEESQAAAKMNGTLHRRYASVRRLFLAYVWYAVCLAPAPLLNMFPSQPNPFLPLVFREVLLLGYSTVPVVLLILNAEYRKRVGRILGRALAFLGVSQSVFGKQSKVGPISQGTAGTMA